MRADSVKSDSRASGGGGGSCSCGWFATDNVGMIIGERVFALRSFAPTALLLGNLGAVQLNYGVGAAECRSMMDVLDADGLFFI